MMPGRASAFEILELEPGANAAAIEQAYRRLIKQYHPDRQGGDSSRAAEINRAYRELRGGKAGSDPLQFNEAQGTRRKSTRWPLAALFAGAIAALLIAVGPSVPLTPRLWAEKAHLALPRRMATANADPMATTLHFDTIDDAVREAVRLFRTKDEMALASASRECQRRFREQPGTALLDRCAAFDDAVVGLEDRDPIRDAGPFAPLAVTGRQWSAASALSDDSLAIDGRLDQVRLRVELELAPQVPPVAPAVLNSD
ncbi:MAG TPA: J domain-containing protein [Sphingomicrobium sp.]|nr:J domain-containing protein [Sphingomicrobium sp.]